MTVFHVWVRPIYPDEQSELVATCATIEIAQKVRQHHLAIAIAKKNEMFARWYPNARPLWGNVDPDVDIEEDNVLETFTPEVTT